MHRVAQFHAIARPPEGFPWPEQKLSDDPAAIESSANEDR